MYSRRKIIFKKIKITLKNFYIKIFFKKIKVIHIKIQKNIVRRFNTHHNMY
jgi:hypothetical protein